MAAPSPHAGVAPPAAAGEPVLPENMPTRGSIRKLHEKTKGRKMVGNGQHVAHKLRARDLGFSVLTLPSKWARAIASRSTHTSGDLHQTTWLIENIESKTHVCPLELSEAPVFSWP